MKTTAWALAVVAGLGGAAAQESEAIDAIHASRGAQVEIEIGDSFSVSSRNARSGEAQVTRRGSTLMIAGSRTNPDIRYLVTLPGLPSSIRASSQADVHAMRLRYGYVGPQPSFMATSGGTIVVEDLSAELVEVTASSLGEVELSGTGRGCTFTLASSAEVDSPDFVCDTAKVKLSSGSSLRIAVQSRLTGEASSGASLRYRGAPSVVSVESSAGASVRRE